MQMAGNRSGWSSLEGLTRREREVLQAAQMGLPAMALADRLGVSRNTLKYHLRNIYSKLGVASRTQALRIYAQQCPGGDLQRRPIQSQVSPGS